MSTSYYMIREPFSRLSVTTAYGAHTVHVEIAGSPAGELRCGSGLLATVLSAFADRDGQIEHWSSGIASYLPDSFQLISGYGDLTTLGELRRGVAP